MKTLMVVLLAISVSACASSQWKVDEQHRIQEVRVISDVPKGNQNIIYRAKEPGIREQALKTLDVLVKVSAIAAVVILIL